MKRLNRAVLEHQEHFDSIVPSPVPMYSDKTSWHLQWETPLEKPWKRHLQESNFQNVPRCLGPQELVPLVRVSESPTIHYQPAT